MGEGGVQRLAEAATELYRAANLGEWHSQVDCWIEGRGSTCKLCKASKEIDNALDWVNDENAPFEEATQ
jgi:hypothetical protein